MNRVPLIHTPKTRNVLMIAFVFVIGITIGVLATTTIETTTNPLSEKGVRIQGAYKLVAPLLLCSSTQSGNFEPYLELEKKIQTQIATAKSKGGVSDVSVYFRDFKGNWLDINGATQYAPASLLKVPIMIAYLKEAESDSQILNTRLRYDGLSDENSAEAFPSPNDLPIGSYTINELIKAMIVNSDNNAATLLYNHMNKGWLSEVYSDLGLTLKPGGDANTQDITAKQYSYFFRILYNATYLNPADSEKALEYLIGSDFPQGLESTVPKDVQVANKFGERTIETQNGSVVERELHDCGIVYTPASPFLICIMTRGKDFASLTNVIDSIGSTVYRSIATP